MSSAISAIRQAMLLAMVLLAMAWPATAMAQQSTYDVDYKDASLETIIKDLRRLTDYQFVYKKETMQGVPSVTCTYKGATLQQLLDRIFYEEGGLDYEISNGTIILKKATGERPYFKRIVTGIVTDEYDEPLPGVSVVVHDTMNGVVTDLEGAFSIMVEGKAPQLDFSCIGLKPLSMKLTSRTEKFLMVRMSNDEKLLDEVLVTGYQNIKRENATGSYQLITSKSLDQRYTGDVTTNLEGKIPGLISYNNGYNEGGESALTIRGTGSFNAATSPLVVVDGLPVEGGLGSVNPYNIENITVLKDAAAASIYGARASNGVIVITTKQAKSDRLEVGFSADMTFSEKNDYSYMQWASASELIALEQYNFQYVKNSPSHSAYQNLQSYYSSRRMALSPIVRLLMAREMGDMTAEEVEKQLALLGRNNYYDEWQQVWERPQMVQQYNLSLRNQGKHVNSSIVLNYKADNEGISHEYDRELTFSYRGDLNPLKWLNVQVGANLISERQKTHIYSEWSLPTAFAPYMSMYDADGSLAQMEAGAYLAEPSLADSRLGLKSEAYNLNDEVNRNFNRTRTTNIRSYVHATASLLEGWSAGAMFQYEDIYTKSDAYSEADSYDMRHLYNLYTAADGTHNLPDGGMLKSATTEGSYYTFRAQTDFSRELFPRHNLEALLGFEFRQSQFKSMNTCLLGYDEQSQTNNMGTTSLGLLKDLEGTASALGSYYSMYGAPDGNDYTTSNVLHRFYSIYFNANYTYDHRYSASVSYRVDKTDLFGADPEFRGRPLWSVGGSWNIHNEQFMKSVGWIDALKLRASYGLTGNIAQDFSSYLTATVGVNEINGVRMATLNTPPNDQLRWEKTASLNVGLDFALLKGRLTGVLDYYRKKGSDLLTTTDLDPTTGWTSLTINNGKLLNTGFEVQLNGEIITARSRNQLAINASLGVAYNKNEVTSVNHSPTTGTEALMAYTFHKGYPVHSLFSYKFAGMKETAGLQYFGWEDHEGNVHYSDIEREEFTPADVVYSGSLDPKWSASFTPSIAWRGFTLSAMMVYYGGHVMRARSEDWTYDGSASGYNSLAVLDAVPSSYLNYWTSATSDQYPANGYAGSTNVVGNSQYVDANVVPADYFKLRNVVLGYDFPAAICRTLRVKQLRLRAQVNNVWTWTRNSLDVDPEACNPITGESSLRTPRSYTVSLSVNL